MVGISVPTRSIVEANAIETNVFELGGETNEQCDREGKHPLMISLILKNIFEEMNSFNIVKKSSVVF